MRCFRNGSAVELARNQVATAHDAKGALLRVTRGIVWITQESDPEDIVLRAGDNWVLERDGLTVIQAHVDATFCLEGATIFEQTPISPARTLRKRARALLVDYLEKSITRRWVPHV
ncbi:MAG: DUF2917 domain-containing protein [Casimicrobiaceae bacterium]